MSGRVLIYSIHRMEHWWRCIGDQMGFDQAVVLTDRRGAGDRWVTDDFYAAYDALRSGQDTSEALLTPAQVSEFQKNEVDKWAQVIKAAGITMD